MNEIPRQAPGSIQNLRTADESGGPRSMRAPMAEKRLARIGAVLALMVAVFLLRLWTLQLKQTEHYADLARENFTRRVRVPAMRGAILDRHGIRLADNRPAYNVTIKRGSGRKAYRQFVEQCEILARHLGRDPEAFVERAKLQLPDRFRDVLVAEDIPWELMLALEERRLELKGVQVVVSPRRVYPYGSTASHLVGYMNEVSRTELEQRQDYQPGDRIGRAGIENSYESDLRGREGEETIIVSAHEVQRDSISRLEPVPGHDVRLTLDSELQASVAEIIEGSPGAVIVMDPRDGAILAMVSYPSYNPDRLGVGHGFINRAVAGVYPPGSVYKILTTAAILEERVVSARTEHFCPGYYGRSRKGCWIWDKRKYPNSPRGHGSLDLHGAFQRSCDVYFYKTGEAMGIQKLHDWAVRFGFGAPTGIDIPGERLKLGNPPDVALTQLQPGEILNASIGQGTVTTTPLQIACMTAAIANDGVLMRPRLGDAILSATGDVVRMIAPEGRDVGLSRSTLDTVQESMYRVVNVLRGTGRTSEIAGLDVCGKTGSAQHEFAHLPTHAWFTCYAPRKNPEVVVVVLLEKAGHGGSHAGPVARKVLLKWQERFQHGESADVAKS